MPKIRFSDAAVSKLKPPGKGQQRHFQTVGRGVSLVLTVGQSSKSWSCMLYENGRSKLYGLKDDAGRPARFPRVLVAQAKLLAMTAFTKPETVQPKPDVDTFGQIAEKYFKFVDHERAPKGRRRTVGDMRGTFLRYLSPWADLPIAAIRKSMVMELHDQITMGEFVQPKRVGWQRKVKLKGGARTADVVAALVRTIFNWHALRHDTFVSPLPRGMVLGKTKARKRILTDDEIRTLWKVTADGSALGAVFSGMLRFALLTASRIGKITAMRWSEFDRETGIWTLPVEIRAKPHIGRVKLSPMAIAVLDQLPRHSRGDLVFSLDGVTPLAKFATFKRKLDVLMPVEKKFVLHDLRRSARSLMSRAGVPREDAERALGHTIGETVEAVYDQFEYLDAKSAALAALADEVARVVGNNIIAFKTA